MMYELYDWRLDSFLPLRWWATANMALFGSPFNPLSHTRAGRAIVAGSDLLLRTTRRYPKPSFGVTETWIDGQRTAVTEEKVLEKPFCTLLHFKRDTAAKHPTVLVVAPLSGHYATLLRDTVRSLLRDHDVYVTDWADASMVPVAKGTFAFDDYVAYVREFIATLGPNVHVISVCQPTVPVLAAISLMASNGERTPLTMTMMGGPVDTRRNPTAVNTFAMRRSLSWFEEQVICRVPSHYPGRGRKVCPGFFLLAGFVYMNADRHLESHRDYFFHLVEGDGESAESHRKFYDEYNAVMDLPADYYLDTIQRVFQEHQLPRGNMVVAGKPVVPADITKSALFTIEGELDDISGAGQTQACHDLCTGIPESRRSHLTVEGAGHYGIFSGRRYREIIYPEIRAFIARHDAAL
ncbi:MAG: polyhydroxyalkanoate depolymerase [Polyangiaceae bacterium]